MNIRWQKIESGDCNYSAWVDKIEVCHLWKKDAGELISYQISELITGQTIYFNEYKSLKDNFESYEKYKNYIFSMCDRILVSFWRDKRKELLNIIEMVGYSG